MYHRTPPGLHVPAPCPYPRGEGGRAIPPKPEALAPMRTGPGYGRANALPPHPRGAQRRAHRVQPLDTDDPEGVGGSGYDADGPHGRPARHGASSAPSLGAVGAPVPKAGRRDLGKGSAGTTFVVRPQEQHNAARGGGAGGRRQRGGPVNTDSIPPEAFGSLIVGSANGGGPRPASSSTAEDAAMVALLRRVVSNPATDDEAALREAVLGVIRDEAGDASSSSAQQRASAPDASSSSGSWFGLVAAVTIPDSDEIDAELVASSMHRAGGCVVSVACDRVAAVFRVRTEQQPDAPESAAGVALAAHGVVSDLLRSGVSGAGIAVGRVESPPSQTPGYPSFADGPALRDAFRAAAASSRSATDDDDKHGGARVAVTSRCSAIFESVGVVAWREAAGTEGAGVLLMDEFDPQGDREDTLP